MGILLEIVLVVLQFLGELIVQVLAQMVGDIAGHSLREVFRPSEPPSPFFAALGYLILGAILGGVSLWIMPKLFIEANWLRAANIVITPLLAGFVMGRIGAWRRRHNKEVIRLESFAYGVLFSFSATMVRAVWGE